VKELAPIRVNWEVSDDLIASIAVSIPTRAIIPKAMMHIVRTALTLFDLIALTAILRLSLKIPMRFTRFISSVLYLLQKK
jgi:glyoxylate utilization-related uncharacterized protein